MNSTEVKFPCGNIVLEGAWHFPPENRPFSSVIVCHPHPLYGGNMLNNVVIVLCQALAGHTIAAFRFNFRGVGDSGGSFGGGIAEQKDVKAALDFISSSPDIDPQRIGLAGYSFGASVALPVAFEDERVSRLALISPPLSDSSWHQLKDYRKAKFLIVGDADSFIPQEQFQQHCQDIPEPKQWVVVSRADHFWWGYEGEIGQKVAQFFAAGFSQA